MIDDFVGQLTVLLFNSCDKHSVTVGLKFFSEVVVTQFATGIISPAQFAASLILMFTIL